MRMYWFFGLGTRLTKTRGSLVVTFTCFQFSRSLRTPSFCANKFVTTLYPVGQLFLLNRPGFLNSIMVCLPCILWPVASFLLLIYHTYIHPYLAPIISRIWTEKILVKSTAQSESGASSSSCPFKASNSHAEEQTVAGSSASKSKEEEKKEN